MRLDPGFLPARFNLANALNALGRNDEALSVLREGARRHPDEGELFYSLGLLLAEVGEGEAAADALERAGALMPERGRVHYNRGVLLTQLGRSEEAEAALVLALKSDDRDPEVLHALVDLHVKREQWERALPYAERFAEVTRGAPVAAELLARVRAGLEER